MNATTPTQNESDLDLVRGLSSAAGAFAADTSRNVARVGRLLVEIVLGGAPSYVVHDSLVNGYGLDADSAARAVEFLHRHLFGEQTA
jgi:proline racemase